MALPLPLRSFLKKVKELAEPGYKPNTEDILKVRDPTRTIETLDFQYGKAKFRCAAARRPAQMMPGLRAPPMPCEAHAVRVAATTFPA